jgi:hypothetical protein
VPPVFQLDRSLEGALEQKVAKGTKVVCGFELSGTPVAPPRQLVKARHSTTTFFVAFVAFVSFCSETPADPSVFAQVIPRMRASHRRQFLQDLDKLHQALAK